MGYNDNKFVFIGDISVGDLVISVVFLNDYLCYSSIKYGYKMYNIKTGAKKDIKVPLQDGTIPRITRIIHYNNDKNYNKLNDHDNNSKNGNHNDVENEVKELELKGLGKPENQRYDCLLVQLSCVL